MKKLILLLTLAISVNLNAQAIAHCSNMVFQATGKTTLATNTADHFLSITINKIIIVDRQEHLLTFGEGNYQLGGSIDLVSSRYFGDDGLETYDGVDQLGHKLKVKVIKASSQSYWIQVIRPEIEATWSFRADI
jgi:hypothetical protein